MSKQQLLILDKDVYVLTPEGSREIRGTATYKGGIDMAQREGYESRDLFCRGPS